VQHCLLFPVFSMTQCQHNANQIGCFQGPILRDTPPIFKAIEKVNALFAAQSMIFDKQNFLSISDASCSYLISFTWNFCFDISKWFSVFSQQTLD
jgi:hypothetical protein